MQNRASMLPMWHVNPRNIARPPLHSSIWQHEYMHELSSYTDQLSKSLFLNLIYTHEKAAIFSLLHNHLHPKTIYYLLSTLSSSDNQLCVSFTSSFLLALNPSFPSVSTLSNFKITCANIVSDNFLYSKSLAFLSDGGRSKYAFTCGKYSKWNPSEI